MKDLTKAAALGLTAAVTLTAGLKALDILQRAANYACFTGAKKLPESKRKCEPVPIRSGRLAGFSNGNKDGRNAVLIFGGSFDTAFNAVAKYGNLFKDSYVCSYDYFGCGESPGKMSLSSMKAAALRAVNAVLRDFPAERVTVLGYSFGCGMATYAASQVKVGRLVLVAGYRSSADLYNIYTPVFFGPAKMVISQNIRAGEYAGKCRCPAFVIGSDSDRQLGPGIQRKLGAEFPRREIRIFSGIRHGDYFKDEKVTDYINRIIGGESDDN